ncbi:MFS transporter [Streptomyces javensis]|uniref:MFS transporter n=1 Tax=Streptomyces javensis TaxID=114698 RepID=A0ABS0R5V9_9ACTN|nr:MFS transporter [Streptomyces javensis]
MSPPFCCWPPSSSPSRRAPSSPRFRCSGVSWASPRHPRPGWSPRSCWPRRRSPIAGRLGDLLGHRPVLLACLGCLAAGGVLAAVSDRAGWLGGVLAGRALQGVSGGVFPLTFGLARRWTPPERLHGVIAALSAMFGVGGALAMAVAGPLAGALGTAALSPLSVLITFLALAGLLTRLPRGGAPARGARHGTVLDLPGTLLLAAALVALLLGVTQGRTWGWGMAFLASAAVAAVALALSAALPGKRTSDGRRPTRSPSRPCAVRRTRRTRRDSAHT